MADQDTIFTEEAEFTPVEEIFEEQAPAGPVLQSDEQVKLTADMSALLELDEANASFDQASSLNQEIIRLGDEVSLRNRAKIKQQRRRNAALQELQLEAVGQDNVEEAVSLIDLEINPSLQEMSAEMDPDYHALEKLSVEKLQNTEMIDDEAFGAAQRLGFAEDTGSTIDKLRDETAKTLIYQRHLDAYLAEVRSRARDEKLIENTRDFAAMFLLPFYDQQSRLNVNPDEDVDRQGLNQIRPGLTIKDQIEGFWSKDIEEFDQAVVELFERARNQSGVFGVNEQATLQALNEYRNGTIGQTNVIFTDAVSALDSLIVVAPFIKAAVGGTRSLAGAAKAAGARRTAATIDADALYKTLRREGEASADITEEGIQSVKDLMPTGLRSKSALEDLDPSIGISGTLAAKLDEIEQIGQAHRGIITQGRLSADQLQELVDKKLVEIKQNKEGLDIEDFKQITDPVTGITNIETFIGKKGGGGYATKLAAQSAAVRRGFDSADVAEDSGRFFIKTTDVVEELTPDGRPLITRPDNSLDTIPGTGPVRTAIQNPKLSLPEDLATRLQDSEITEFDVIRQVATPLAKDIRKIGKKNLKSLETLMTKGRNERRWYQLDEFAVEWKKITGKDPTELDFTAYAASKQLSDFTWDVFNNAVYSSEARRGAKTVDIVDNVANIDIRNATAYELKMSPESVAKTRLFDVEDKVVRTGKGDTSPEEIADLTRKLTSGDYKVLRLKESHTIEGDPIDTMLVPSRSADVKPLNRVQLNYVPGGPLLRRTKWFAKQAQTGSYKDGTKWVKGPRTTATFRTEGQAQKWVDEINEGIDIYKDYLANRTPFPSVNNAKIKILAQTELERTPFEGLDNIARMVDEGEISLDHPYEAVFDRGVPSFYFDSSQRTGDDVVDLFTNNPAEDLDGQVQWMFNTGRDFYGKRTKGLLTPDETKDVTLDPLASISKAVQYAARTHAWDHYINRSVEEWVRNAAPFIQRETLGNQSDARHVFYNGVLDPQLRVKEPGIYDKLTENRVLIKRQLGLKTPTQERFEAAKRNLARMVEAKGGDLGTKLVAKLDDIQSGNPINAINALMFDAWLGFFDVSQLFVQAQTIGTAVSASPKYGASAVGMFLPMRWLTINKSDNLLDYIAQKAKVIHGQEPSDFKEMIRTFRESAWNKPGGELAYLDNHSNSVGAAGAGWRIQKAREGSRMFFNEAERWNRMVAYQIAWKETRADFPKLAVDSAEFKARVNKRTSDFSINMTAANNSKIQSGVFSSTTRFLSYQMRLLEAILPKQLGGSDAFSGTQKASMLGAQVLLYGSKGLPFGQRISDLAHDMIVDATGQEPSFEVTKAIESGAIDSILYAISGGDLNTDFAERAGFGRGLDYTLQRMANGELYSFTEALGGPAYSFASNYAESFNRVAIYLKGTRGPLDVDAQDAKFVFNELVTKHIASLKRADKALTIMRLSKVINPKTGRPLFDATELEAGAAVLGVPLWEESKRFEYYNRIQDRRDQVRVYGQLIAKIERQAIEALVNGDTKVHEQHKRQVALLFASFQDDPLLRQQIAKFVSNEMGYAGNEFEKILRDMQKTLGKDISRVPTSDRFREEQDQE